jgi:hypothetical protein
MCALTSRAQESSIGLEFGPTISQTERENYDYYEPFVGVSANAFYQFEKKGVFTRSGIGLIQKGFNQELVYVDEAGNILGEGAVESVKHSYVNISQVAGVKFGNTYFGSVAIGARLAHYNKTVVSSARFELDNGTYIDAYKWKMNYLEPWDVSALAIVGLGYKDELDRTFYVSMSYDYGFTKVKYRDLSTEIPFNHLNWTLQIGFSRLIPSLKK